jgi:dipeptidase E
VVPRIYGAAPIWEGLSVLPYFVVPHFESPGHPETEACGRLAEQYRREGLPHRTLHDGQAIVIDGDTSEVVPAE